MEIDIINILKKLTISDYIAVTALFFSMYAAKGTRKLNQLQIEKESKELINTKRANISARVIKLGSSGGYYKLKIFNSGKSKAFNVRIEFPEENKHIDKSDVESKFPMESLDIQQAVELLIHYNFYISTNKFAIKLIWSDEYKNYNENIVHLTI